VFAAERKCHKLHASVYDVIVEIVNDANRLTLLGETGHLLDRRTQVIRTGENRVHKSN